MTGHSRDFIDLQEVRQLGDESAVVHHRNNEDIRAHTGNECEQRLRQRIRELESIVTSQNVELQEKETLKRNYDAVVEKLNRVTTEKDAIEDDRERLFKEKTFYEDQAVRNIKDIEIYQEKLNESNRLVVEIQIVKEGVEEKLRQLEQEVLYWKGKYENKEDKISSSAKKINTGIQSKQNKESQSGIPQDAKRRRRTFRQSQTVLPQCKNCLTVFDRLEPHKVQCCFHRSLPQPWKTWKKQIGVRGQNPELDHANNEGYMYWPCCEHVGLKEPPGCLKLKSHDLIYPKVQE